MNSLYLILLLPRFSMVFYMAFETKRASEANDARRLYRTRNRYRPHYHWPDCVMPLDVYCWHTFDCTSHDPRFDNFQVIEIVMNVSIVVQSSKIRILKM